MAVFTGALLGAATLSPTLTAQAGAKNVRDGVFTADQALRGKSGYDGVCARCHGVPLTGSQGNGPTLKGQAFLAHWDKDTLGSLFTKIRDTMPLGVAGHADRRREAADPRVSARAERLPRRQERAPRRRRRRSKKSASSSAASGTASSRPRRRIAAGRRLRAAVGATGRISPAPIARRRSRAPGSSPTGRTAA